MNTETEKNPASAQSDLTDGFAVILEQMERDAFEKWCRENNGIPARLKGTDQYIVPVVQGSWTAWKARAAYSKPAVGQSASNAVLAADFYGNGEKLPTIHPDAETNNEILIGELCAKLDTARQALGRALEMNVVTPAAVAMKNHIRWALDETHPRTLTEQSNNCG